MTFLMIFDRHPMHTSGYDIKDWMSKYLDAVTIRIHTSRNKYYIQTQNNKIVQKMKDKNI